MKAEDCAAWWLPLTAEKVHKAFAPEQQVKAALAFPRELSSKHLTERRGDSNGYTIAVFWLFNDFVEALESVLGVNVASSAGLKVK